MAAHLAGAMVDKQYFEEAAVAGPEHEGMRLDMFAANAFADYSRSFLQKAIKHGEVTLNGSPAKPKTPVSEGDEVRARLPALVEPSLEPEPIALDILYEDDSLLVINKPANMVTHPSRGAARGTLANALLHHCLSLSDLSGPLRPGIVHRLDRDTTGCILAAKTNAAHAGLSEQFRLRTVEKHYRAIVRGRMEFDEQLIDQPIGRDPRTRERMKVRGLDGRSAISRCRVVERFEKFTYVDIRLLTGRTHQARVHMHTIAHPVAADAAYGGGGALTRSLLLGERPLPGEKPLIERPALHAAIIGFTHPVSGEAVRFEAPLPEDMAAALGALRERG